MKLRFLHLALGACGFMAGLSTAWASTSLIPPQVEVFKSVYPAVEVDDPNFSPLLVRESQAVRVTLARNQMTLNMRQMAPTSWLLEIFWSAEAGGKKFRLAFLPADLNRLEDEDFYVQAPDDTLVPILPEDRSLIAELAHGVKNDTKQFKNKDRLIQILAVLSGDPLESSYHRYVVGSMCHRIGLWTYGRYTAHHEVKFVLAPVGAENSNCFGRCGGGCGAFASKRHTSDCLAHDICHRVEGTQLGECKDEFLDAATTMAAAPACRL